jgi:uridine kinase
MKQFISRNTLIVLVLKLLLGTLFASYFLRDLFIPFINYFIQSGFSNPWDHFLDKGVLKAFPYGPAMLYVLTLGKLIIYPVQLLFGPSLMLDLFGCSLVFGAADLAIYIVLMKFFKRQEKKVFWIYFCSPIVIYISYFHGQLDIIPIAFLMGSIWCLSQRNYNWSALLLGISINAKLSTLLALPFIIVFLLKKREIRLSIKYFVIVVVTYGILILPFLTSEGYRQLVFSANEQTWLFDFSIAFGGKGLVLLLGPLFLGLLFINFLSYGRISKDTLLMFIGLAFMMLVTFVTPMPGWYMWSYPFIVYAFLEYNDFPRFPIFGQIAAYFVYFIFYSESTFLDSFGVLFPQLQHATLAGTFGWVYEDPKLADSILFVPLATSMFYLMCIMFFLGVKNNRLVNFRKRPYLIGVGGDSGTGKHTLADLCKMIFGESRTLQINGDADHKWERGHEMWSAFTHLNPKANNLYVQFEQTSTLKHGRTIQRVEYDHGSGKFTHPRDIKPDNYLVFVGLHPYYIPQMRSLFDLKIYMDTDESLRLRWKVERDQAKRGYSLEKVQEQIKNRLPDAEKFIRPQAGFADLLIKYREGDPEKKVLTDYTVSTKWNMEHLLEYFEALKETNSFSIAHSYDEDWEKQTLTFSGELGAEHFKTYVEQNFELYEEYINKNYRFDGNYNGFTQLVILHLVMQSQQLEFAGK